MSLWKYHKGISKEKETLPQ